MEYTAAPSLIKRCSLQIIGFLSTVEAFGDISFSGNRYAALRSMKFGKKVVRRVKKSLT
jgi:hypothetical protein